MIGQNIPAPAPSITSATTNVWIPAAAWIPRTTTGVGVDSRQLTTNNFDELLFDPGTNEFAQALVVMPNSYNNGTVNARFYWTCSTGTGDVVWGIQGVALADDIALSTAMGTAVTVLDTVITANDMHISNATAACTITGSPAANRPIEFQIFRDAALISDSMGADARLLGVEILFN